MMAKYFQNTMIFMAGRLISIFLLMGCVGLILPVSAAPAGDSSSQIAEINNYIRENITESNHKIEQADIKSAIQYSDEALKGLNTLLQIFMPLDARIKKLLNREQDIKRDTDALVAAADLKKPESGSIDRKSVQYRQQENKAETADTIELLDRLLQYQDQAATPGNGKQGAPAGKADLKKTYEAVKGSLHEAHNFQGRAVDNLGSSAFHRAADDEKAAIAKLEEALEKLNPKQPKQKQSNQSQANNRDQDKQPSQSTGQNGKNQKRDNQQQARETNQQPRADRQSSEQMKMTPEEALKQLTKLERKAEQEKKRRERKSGRIAVPEQVPVEKDW